MNTLRARAAWICCLLFFIVLPVTADGQAAAPGRHAIASAHPDATAAGRSILDAGGNAFDAAIAVAAALAVVEPYSSGIGGGGFFLLHRADDGSDHFVDARETAPAAANADMYLDDKGEFASQRALDGALAAGIPGLPAGLVHLAEHYGRLPLARSLAPAIHLARDGFAVTERYQLMAGFRAQAFAVSPEGARIFLHEGGAPPLGHVIRQPDLADTLEALGHEGVAGFYQGEVARRLVDGVRAAGGLWTLEDLAAYRIKERAPIRSTYGNIQVVSAPPPSSGGIVLAEALNILEHYDLAALDADQRRHVVIEAMRRAYRDRADFLGDPDFVEMPVERLVSQPYADELAATLSLEQATPSSTLPGIGLDQRGQDTTHFSVLDAAGNRVAATLSINYPFGALTVPPGTGVLLNNEMDDFSAAPLTPNAYGLVGAGANAIAPGKRPLSSMTPTFVESPTRLGILGTPGGSRIISMVLLGVLDFAAGAPPSTWVATPRYHHQYLPDAVEYEEGGLAAASLTALRAKGHTLKEVPRNYGNMQAILWDRASGAVEAASDPRGEGAAAVWSTAPAP